MVSLPAAAPATTPEPTPAIRATGLAKRFGPVVALAGLDLEVPRGIVFGLLGPNGAGKTTTIRLLTGLARPSAGSARVAGVDIASGDPVRLRRRIGVLDQDPRYYAWMTGRELLAFVGGLLDVDAADLRARVGETLERVGLADAADRRIGGYSGGMRQRLGIGQAIIGRPEIVFLDEPVNSLDPEGRRDLLALVGELRETATVILSTHVLSDVERVCDRVGILDRGTLVAETAIDELLARFALPSYRLDADPGQAPALEALAGRLRGLGWVTTVTRTGDALRILVADERAAAAGLLPIVAEAGIVLRAFERERPTLEDAFLRLVGRDAPAPASPGPTAPAAGPRPGSGAESGR
jgi:ABC-2 type transport system ATP-binding protein